jgi:hypothetical protein
MSNEQQNNSRVLLALFLIAFGLFWLLRKLSTIVTFPVIHFEKLFLPIRHFFHGWGHFIFSWQIILIIIGLILLAGKRQVGLVLIIVGGIFILPRFFFFPGLTISLLFPVLLIAAGVAIVTRRI